MRSPLLACLNFLFPLQDPHKESCQTFCTHLLRVAVVAFLFVHHLSLCWDCRKVTNNAYVIVVALWPAIFLPIGERNSSILRLAVCLILLCSCIIVLYAFNLGSKGQVQLYDMYLKFWHYIIHVVSLLAIRKTIQCYEEM